MISWIYALPIEIVILVIIFLPIIRGLMGHKSKLLNIVFLFISILLIIKTTLIRENCGESVLILKPFYSFILAKEQPEFYREVIMNILLFLPIGMFLPFVFKRNNITKTLLISLIFSIIIECIQYKYCLGTAEIDDVIFNVLGSLLGSMSFLICKTRRC